MQVLAPGAPPQAPPQNPGAGDQMQIFMMNQMMMQQMSAQQIQAAQLAAMAGGRDGGSGRRHRCGRGSSSVNIQRKLDPQTSG